MKSRRKRTPRPDAYEIWCKENENLNHDHVQTVVTTILPALRQCRLKQRAIEECVRRYSEIRVLSQYLVTYYVLENIDDLSPMINSVQFYKLAEHFVTTCKAERKSRRRFTDPDQLALYEQLRDAKTRHLDPMLGSRRLPSRVNMSSVLNNNQRNRIAVFHNYYWMNFFAFQAKKVKKQLTGLYKHAVIDTKTKKESTVFIDTFASDLSVKERNSLFYASIRYTIAAINAPDMPQDLPPEILDIVLAHRQLLLPLLPLTQANVQKKSKGKGLRYVIPYFKFLDASVACPQHKPKAYFVDLSGSTLYDLMNIAKDVACAEHCFHVQTQRSSSSR